jgi:hypothetical protein
MSPDRPGLRVMQTGGQASLAPSTLLLLLPSLRGAITAVNPAP